MLLKFIKKNDLGSLLLIPLAGVLLWYKSFQSPPSVEAFSRDGVMPLFGLIMDLMKNHYFWQVLTGFILVLLNSFLITRICSSFVLFKKGSRLPGIIYLLVISSWKVLQTIHPVHLATLCVLLTIFYIFSTYQKELEISFTFNASFLLSMASMFYLPSAILLPVVWISIFILQKSDNWRLLFVPFFGFMVPWLFLLSIAFMSDTLGSLISTLNGIIWAANSSYLLNPVFLTISAFMIFLMLLGTFSFLTSYQYIKLSARKFFVVFYWMLAIIGISTLSFSSIGIEVIALVTIPAAFLVSIFFLSGEKMFWKEIIFLILIVLLVFNNLINVISS
jgi:hypothetical protein